MGVRAGLELDPSPHPDVQRPDARSGHIGGIYYQLRTLLFCVQSASTLGAAATARTLLEEVLVPVYFYHRYQLQAAASA